VTCGSGTYIRSLARDIGAALRTGGYCSALTRWAVGPFRLEDSVTIDALDPAADLIDPLAALESLPRVVLPAAAARDLAMGKAVHVDPLPPGRVELAAIDEQGRLIALAKPADAHGRIRPTKVFGLNG
jgi:tRNA pseudouridine55 synthase